MMSGHRIKIIDLVDMGQIDAVKALIDKGCDVNEKGETGRTAVFSAIDRNDFNMVKLLIDSGAKLDIQDGFGLTPLSLAKKRKFQQIIKFLEVTLDNSIRHEQISPRKA